MRSRQQGVSFMGFLIIAVLLVIGAIGGMKVAPAYIEYFAVKKAVAAIVASGEVRNGTVADVKRAFDRRAQVDNISIVSGADLEVSKEGGEVVISFAYPKKVPLFGNVSLLIEFAGSSNAS